MEAIVLPLVNSDMGPGTTSIDTNMAKCTPSLDLDNKYGLD